jgi:hypothetical protein
LKDVEGNAVRFLDLADGSGYVMHIWAGGRHMVLFIPIESFAVLIEPAQTIKARMDVVGESSAYSFPGPIS